VRIRLHRDVLPDNLRCSVSRWPNCDAAHGRKECCVVMFIICAVYRLFPLRDPQPLELLNDFATVLYALSSRLSTHMKSI
jgi:hypothetical protein